MLRSEHLQMDTYLKNKILKLEIIKLNKSYENQNILRNISLKVYQNEFVSILGTSGCGKSTIFNIIAGITIPNSGNVIIDGVDTTGETGVASYMHQKDLLLPWMKIIDNAALPLIIKGIKKEEAKQTVLKYFEAFGLSGCEKKYPKMLSGGMRQRAALLRTYMFSNNLMLLDEPFGALDAITRSKMQYWLQDMASNLKTTIVFITHDIEEAILLSNRIYILSGTPATVKTEVLVELPKARTKDIITSVEFNEIKKTIINDLVDN